MNSVESINSLIEMVQVTGLTSRQALEGLIHDVNVRAFFDSGILSFATLEDISIDEGLDERVDYILSIINENEWPSDHPAMELVDGYEGSLQTLYIDLIELVEPRGLKRRTLAQKQGSRKAGRTKARRQYMENAFGAIAYHYYYRPANQDDATKR